MTLYIKLGGRRAITQAMPRLQARLEQDTRFAFDSFRKEFECSDDLCEFLIFLFGGAPFYDGKPVYELLSPVCTSADVYEQFVDHLVSVFLGSKFSGEDETNLRRLMERLRPQVLSPKPAAPVLVYSAGKDILSA